MEQTFAGLPLTKHLSGRRLGGNDFFCYVLKEYAEWFHLIPNIPMKEMRQKQPHAAGLPLSSAL